MMGTLATTAEIHGVLNGVPADRLTEIIGRSAAAGEQLGLSLTSSRDANSWLDHSERRASQATAAKALAEITGYYAMSAGHGLANITLRMLLLDSKAASIINAAYRKANGFQPFADNKEAWRPLSSNLVKVLQRAAHKVDQPAVTSLTEVVAELSTDTRWRALVSRRDIDYHRWRQQSVSRAVPKGSSWQSREDGARVIGVKSNPVVDLPDYKGAVTEVDQALDALSCAMDNWLTLLPDATHQLGVPIFKQSPHS